MMPIKVPAKSVRITAVAGGFTLAGSGSLSDVGTPFVAEVAYRTRMGNPFRKYSRFDFAIDGLRVAADGVALRVADGNRLEIVPARPDFHVAVTGFDPRRDLVVRVSKKDDDAPETELH